MAHACSPYFALPCPRPGCLVATPGVLAWGAPWSSASKAQEKGRGEICSLVTLACNQRSYKTLESPFPRRKEQNIISSVQSSECVLLISTTPLFLAVTKPS
ncbi:hypothetical protein ONS95_005708 [Cadophora gregata]|uniref:uncharacterized protein n=1 Tax=Cadophora gregata TaxID=51156 RepID=UPI0026DBB7CD|nr:uncharacterized protein ONS95_005708 [Cadophora gregata]KAK0103701.1 hypothetical protein ONS95_005708 [Cadophora gregata]KAK0107890.1 hypothetical protein ONS96_003677 [Cadophora gregata f. sp. sojae]